MSLLLEMIELQREIRREQSKPLAGVYRTGRGGAFVPNEAMEQLKRTNAYVAKTQARIEEIKQVFRTPKKYIEEF